MSYLPCCVTDADNVLINSLHVLEDRLKQKRDQLAKLKSKVEALPEEETITTDADAATSAAGGGSVRIQTR